MDSYLLLTLAAFTAGVMNAMAGGGSFVSFPALVFTSVPPIIANASSTVALFPGAFSSAYAYRKDFVRFEDFPFLPSWLVSLAGGASGAWLLLNTPEHAFKVIIPWLLGFATVLFTFGPKISPWLRSKVRIGVKTVLCLQYLVGLYGGYFGGAVGIITMALLSVLGIKDIRGMNALRTVLTGSMNAAAVVYFVSRNVVWWPQTLVMLAAAVVGGYLGAHYTRKMPPVVIRAVVTIIGVTMTVIFFVRG